MLAVASDLNERLGAMHGRDCYCDHCSARANAAHNAYTREYARGQRNGERVPDPHDRAMEKYTEVMKRKPSEFG